MDLFLAMGVIKVSENWEKEMEVVKLREKKKREKDLRYCFAFRCNLCPKVEKINVC